MAQGSSEERTGDTEDVDSPVVDLLASLEESVRRSKASAPAGPARRYLGSPSPALDRDSSHLVPRPDRRRYVPEAIAFVVGVLVVVVVTGLTINAVGGAAPIIGMVLGYVSARSVITVISEVLDTKVSRSRREEEAQAHIRQAAAGSSLSAVAAELERLAELRDRGVISEDEFASQKADLLA